MRKRVEAALPVVTVWGLLIVCVGGCGYYVPMQPGDITEGVEDIINGPPISTFDGQWLNTGYGNAIEITSRTGRVIVSNTRILQAGDIIMVIIEDDGPSFSGRYIFTNGSIRDVIGFLSGPNEITMSDGSLTWTMTRFTSNSAPVVDAGANVSITLPTNYADLSGVAMDDGWPNGALVTTWSLASGPAAVTFGDASATATTATFTQGGTYVLRLEASDGELTASDTLTVFVHAP